MNKIRIGAVVFLCLVGGGLSLLLLSKHYGVPLLGEAALAACGEGGGCDIVDQSRYARFLGFPLAAWGLFFYGSLIALVAPLLLGARDDESDSAWSLGFCLVALAVAIDAILFGLQFAVIKAFCRFCIATYAVNALALLALWPFRGIAKARSFVVDASSRRALGAWSMALIAVASAALAGDAALANRKALAGASILGFVSPASSPAAAAGSLEEQLASARAEAK